jgi:DnaJ domain
MNEHYDKNYNILGIRPGATWQELRRAYKSLVNIWHPDRFQQNTRQRKLAEEKTKEINKSYKELTEYYKKFGALPQAAKKTNIPVTKNTASQNVPDAHTEPANQDTGPPAAVITPAYAETYQRSEAFGRIIAAAALVGAAYFVWQLVLWEPQNDPSSNDEPASQVDKKQDDAKTKKHDVPEKHFTVGSLLGEVYSIQGIPTKTEENVWYYGKSKVYFYNGEVLGWEENPDNPLHAYIASRAEQGDAKFFHTGSSKEEVLATQGAPDSETENVWYYGTSRVYFENGRVTNWYESSFNPLRVQQ